jgi:hypothetical protein
MRKGLPFGLKSLLGLQIKAWALRPLEQEASVSAFPFPEDRGNPIPSTSDTAPVCCCENKATQFFDPLKYQENG